MMTVLLQECGFFKLKFLKLGVFCDQSIADDSKNNTYLLMLTALSGFCPLDRRWKLGEVKEGKLRRP